MKVILYHNEQIGPEYMNSTKLISLSNRPVILSKKKILTQPKINEVEDGIPLFTFNHLKPNTDTVNDKLKALKMKVDNTQKHQVEQAYDDKFSNEPQSHQHSKKYN